MWNQRLVCVIGCNVMCVSAGVVCECEPETGVVIGCNVMCVSAGVC